MVQTLSNPIENTVGSSDASDAVYFFIIIIPLWGVHKMPSFNVNKYGKWAALIEVTIKLLAKKQ